MEDQVIFWKVPRSILIGGIALWIITAMLAWFFLLVLALTVLILGVCN